MDNMRTLLDRIGRVGDEERKHLQRVGAVNTSNATSAPLTFAVGDRVIDLATGKRGTVKAGARGEHVDMQLFRVEIVTGAIVYRNHDELALDKPATAPVES